MKTGLPGQKEGAPGCMAQSVQMTGSSARWDNWRPEAREVEEAAGSHPGPSAGKHGALCWGVRGGTLWSLSCLCRALVSARTHTSVEIAGACSQVGLRRKSHAQAGRTPSSSRDLSVPGSTEEELRLVLARILRRGSKHLPNPRPTTRRIPGVRGRLNRRPTCKGLEQGHGPSGPAGPPAGPVASQLTPSVPSPLSRPRPLPALLWLTALCASPAGPLIRRGGLGGSRQFLSTPRKARLGGVCRSITLPSYIQGGTSLLRSRGQLYQHNFLK